MFSFFFRPKADYRNALSFIGTDMHNHILPGIDDGSADPVISVMLAEGLHDLGYHSMICTPHIISDLYPNTRVTIGNAFKVFKDAAPPHLLPKGINFAAEYMINFDFEALLAGKEILSFGEKRFVLIEMSYLVESSNLKEMIFELLINGYQPILAHPERYHFYHIQPKVYEELVDAGCMLQLNILSLCGYYGGKIKSVAEKMIRQNLFSWVGTDLHHPGQLEILKRLASDKKILRTLEKIKNLQNPELNVQY
jgi:protein-tyrosine phosphatase